MPPDDCHCAWLGACGIRSSFTHRERSSSCCAGSSNVLASGGPVELGLGDAPAAPTSLRLRGCIAPQCGHCVSLAGIAFLQRGRYSCCCHSSGPFVGSCQLSSSSGSSTTARPLAISRSGAVPSALSPLMAGAWAPWQRRLSNLQAGHVGQAGSTRLRSKDRVPLIAEWCLYSGLLLWSCSARRGRWPLPRGALWP